MVQPELVFGGEGRLERGKARKLGLDHRAMAFVNEENTRGAILEHEGELGPGEAEIERHEDRAAARRGEHGEQEQRLVEAEKGDAVAFGDAERREPAGAVLDCALHFAVSPVASFEMERPALRRAERALAEPVRKAKVRGHEFLPFVHLFRAASPCGSGLRRRPCFAELCDEVHVQADHLLRSSSCRRSSNYTAANDVT